MQYLFVILLFFAMFAWGVSWPLSKILSNAHSVFGIAFMRFFLVALCITPILFYSKISIKIPKDKILTIMLNIAFNASYSLLFFYALRFGNAGSAGVITTTLAPIIATFLSVLIFKNKLIKRVYGKDESRTDAEKRIDTLALENRIAICREVCDVDVYVNKQKEDKAYKSVKKAVRKYYLEQLKREK